MSFEIQITVLYHNTVSESESVDRIDGKLHAFVTRGFCIDKDSSEVRCPMPIAFALCTSSQRTCLRLTRKLQQATTVYRLIKGVIFQAGMGMKKIREFEESPSSLACIFARL